MKYRAVVDGVDPDSIAGDLGIEKGDVVCRINGTDIVDYLDYQFLAANEEIVLTVQKSNGETYEFEIFNEDMEDLGINFKNMLFDSPKSCANKCVFCFIDQLPPNMRESLYFKDDDSRLSFLYGNYVTLTNMKREDIERLIRYRISPVNISIHTTNMELRKKMLHNRHADRVMDYIRLLFDNGIRMNMQIVLCKGINDGAELDRTIRECCAYFPMMQSISVVPVGLTKYRDGLYPLEEFKQEDCRKVIRQVEAWQDKLLADKGSRLVYLSDEFYIVGNQPVPNAECYEDFPQIENGVGLIASMQEEFDEALASNTESPGNLKIGIATGVLAYNFINGLVQSIKMRYNKIDIKVYKIVNHFFGEKVTVSGLLCGADLIAQLRGKQFDRLLITKCMLKADEPVFLDDITVEEAERALNTKIVPVDNDGYDFLQKALGLTV